ncbi:tetratricopeptide repeat protein [Uliginosibacterium sp. H3]|uniref:Tetratricopeptide repeat protein n=1 Tax=Uliginosibacterium silvisoli TaxID=3114758 RepID=A0ABU6K2C6_9RHOO|nr:tetratricopeptide repeat protein [Uliginosibacterium sp. H3]
MAHRIAESQTMNVQNVLSKLDSHFLKKEYGQIETLLLVNLGQAFAERDNGSALTLLNELLSYYRSVSRVEESLSVASKAIKLMDEMGLRGTLHYATTLLNIATAYRAAGKAVTAVDMYEQVSNIYREERVDDPHLLASLYNNLSLAWQALNDHTKAIKYLQMALVLVEGSQGEAEQAVTYTNLALSKMRCGRLAEARSDLDDAVRLFKRQKSVSAHYGAALAALGELCYREGNLHEAISCYERALEQIELRYGRNAQYAVTLESLAVVYEDVDAVYGSTLQAEAARVRGALH